MLDFLVVMFLFSPSVAGLSQATATGEFLQCFSGWAEADQVKVSCNNTLIGQYCDPGRQSCRKKIKEHGVLLKKGSNGVCLTVTNSSYDSWSCKAKGYIDGYEQEEVFTVDLKNQQTSSSPNPVSTSTSPSPGNNESHSGPIAAGVSVPIICLVIFVILYMKAKYFMKAICGFFSRLQRNNRTPNQEPDIEKGENKNFL